MTKSTDPIVALSELQALNLFSGETTGFEAVDPQSLQAMVTLTRLMDGYDLSDEPVAGQAWLWAPAQARPFRVKPYDPVITQAELHDILPSLTRWKAWLEQQLHAWREQPVVWRVQDGVAQAVFLGHYRFTWSVDQPQGLVETQDLGQGWVESHRAQSWPDLCLSLFRKDIGGMTLAEQLARHAQRHLPRLTVWQGPMALSLCPSTVPVLAFSDDLALAQRFRAGLRAFLHALARLDPFWRTVARVMWRRYPVGRTHSVAALDNDPLPGILRHWNAWKAVAAEHPRAHLLLGDAVKTLHLAPNMHTWRPEVWQSHSNVYGLLRASTWNAVRTAPLSQLATALRLDSGMTAIEVLTLCQVPHVLPLVLRTVPENWWIRAKEQFQDRPLREAMASFPVRRVRAFLDAAAGHPWVEQRLTLARWCLVNQMVLEWTDTLSESPCEDPSWSWNSLVTAWMTHEIMQNDWPSPMGPTFYRGLRVSVVSSHQVWAMLGGVMSNCLKDERSDGFRFTAAEQRGILVRLSGAGETSAAFIEWSPGSFNGLDQVPFEPDAIDPYAYAADGGYEVPGLGPDPDLDPEAPNGPTPGHEDAIVLDELPHDPPLGTDVDEDENLGLGDRENENVCREWATLEQDNPQLWAYVQHLLNEPVQDGVMPEEGLAQGGNGPSAGRSTPAGSADGAWFISQHYAAHNVMPSQLHQDVATELAVLFDMAVVPGARVPRAEVWRRMIAHDRLNFAPLAMALDDSWGPEQAPGEACDEARGPDGENQENPSPENPPGRAWRRGLRQVQRWGHSRWGQGLQGGLLLAVGLGLYGLAFRHVGGGPSPLATGLLVSGGITSALFGIVCLGRCRRRRPDVSAPTP